MSEEFEVAHRALHTVPVKGGPMGQTSVRKVALVTAMLAAVAGSIAMIISRPEPHPDPTVDIFD